MMGGALLWTPTDDVDGEGFFMHSNLPGPVPHRAASNSFHYPAALHCAKGDKKRRLFMGLRKRRI
jgi:hypothetical protein